MDASPTVLGLDVGTSAIKAVVLDLAGDGVATASVPTPFRTRTAGVEMSVADLFSAVEAVLAGVGPSVAGVTGIGVTSLGESGSWVHEGEVVDAPLIPWHDPRGEDTARRLAAALGGDEVQRRTGRAVRSWSSVAKIGWLTKHGLRPRGRWTGVAGLVVWHLTGALAQEASLAATSGAFDPYVRAYDADIPAAVGLEVDWAPVVDAGAVVGSVSRAAASRTGLTSGVPVTLAGHDHPVGVVGVGGRPGMVVDSMGTGEPLIVAWDASRLERLPRLEGVPGDLTVTCWPGQDTLMLLWEHLRPGLGLRTLARALGADREELEEAARSRPRSSPWGSPELAALEAGRVDDTCTTGSQDSAQVWADALDGYTALAAQAERGLRALTGTDGPTLLIGGGVRSARWVEAKRRVSRYGLVVAGDPDAVARGAARFGGIAAGRSLTARGSRRRPPAPYR